MDSSDEGKIFIALDQGGHASRTVIMDGLGRSLAMARRSLKTFRPREGYVQHDPRELVSSLRDSLAQAAGVSLSRSRRVEAAGLATQRSTIVCWDSLSGEALSPVISWQDTRARDRISSLARKAHTIHERTGLFLSAHYGASKLAWCLENIPEVKKARDSGRLCFGPMSSFLVGQLTDEKPFVSDPVSASRTLLWNINLGDWDEQLLKLFGLEAGSLPVCVPTVHPFGHMEAGRRRVPLGLVTGDQSAAIFAHGKLRSGTAYVNVGTGAFVSRPIGRHPLLEPRLLTSVIHQQGDSTDYALEGTVNGAGSAVTRLQDDLGVKDLWKVLPGWLEEVKEPPLFLNGVSGLAAPYWVPDFVSGFVGGGDGPGKFVAVVESVVFLLYLNVLEMNRRLAPPERIQITGGLAALDGLCQRLADLARVPAYRPAQTEATARGTCYLLAGRPGYWPDTGPGTLFEPAPAEPLRGRFEQWREAMEKKVDEAKERRRG